MSRLYEAFPWLQRLHDVSVHSSKYSRSSFAKIVGQFDSSNLPMITITAIKIPVKAANPAITFLLRANAKRDVHDVGAEPFSRVDIITDPDAQLNSNNPEYLTCK